MSDRQPPPVPVEETASAWAAHDEHAPPDSPAPDAEAVTLPPAESPPSPPPDPPVDPVPTRRRWPIVVAILAAAAVLGTVALLLVAMDDDPDRVVLPEPTDVPPLGPTAQSLVDLLTEGRNHTYHARYRVTGASGVTSIERWNKPGRARIDTVNEAEGMRVQTASILDGNRAFSCRRDGEDEWACSRIETPPGGRLPEDTFDTVEAQLRGRSVSESDETIDGRPAKCFKLGEGTAGYGGDPVDICVSTDGVPLRLASGSASLEAAVVDRDVPDAIFTPPAPPG